MFCDLGLTRHYYNSILITINSFIWTKLISINPGPVRHQGRKPMESSRQLISISEIRANDWWYLVEGGIQSANLWRWKLCHQRCNLRPTSSGLCHHGLLQPQPFLPGKLSSPQTFLRSIFYLNKIAVKTVLMTRVRKWCGPISAEAFK